MSGGVIVKCLRAVLLLLPLGGGAAGPSSAGPARRELRHRAHPHPMSPWSTGELKVVAATSSLPTRNWPGLEEVPRAGAWRGQLARLPTTCDFLPRTPPPISDTYPDEDDNLPKAYTHADFFDNYAEVGFQEASRYDIGTVVRADSAQIAQLA